MSSFLFHGNTVVTIFLFHIHWDILTSPKYFMSKGNAWFPPPLRANKFSPLLAQLVSFFGCFLLITLFLFSFSFFSETGQPWLSSLCRPGHLQTHNDPPASVSLSTGIKNGGGGLPCLADYLLFMNRFSVVQVSFKNNSIAICLVLLPKYCSC